MPRQRQPSPTPSAVCAQGRSRVHPRVERVDRPHAPPPCRLIARSPRSFTTSTTVAWDSTCTTKPLDTRISAASAAIRSRVGASTRTATDCVSAMHGLYIPRARPVYGQGSGWMVVKDRGRRTGPQMPNRGPDLHSPERSKPGLSSPRSLRRRKRCDNRRRDRTPEGLDVDDFSPLRTGPIAAVAARRAGVVAGGPFGAPRQRSGRRPGPTRTIRTRRSPR